VGQECNPSLQEFVDFLKARQERTGEYLIGSNPEEMKTLEIGILQGLLGNPNMGCNALLYSAIRLMQQAAQTLDLSMKITCFSDTHSSELQLYPMVRNTPFVSAIPYMTLRQILADLVKSRGVKRRNMRATFDTCDIFFEIAGGDSFSDIYGMDRLNDANRVHRNIRRLKKPLVFLPQTIGPFSTSEAKKIAQDSLSHARYVFARDPLSYNVASETVAPSRIMQTIDMACFMEYEPTKELDPGNLRVGVNPSGLLWHGGYTGDNQFGLRDDYKLTIRTVIQRLGEMQLHPVLVAHVLNGPGFQVEDDYRVCLQLKSEFPFCSIAPYFYTPIEAKSFISSLDLLVGSRMHACIAAYTAGVPVFPLAYSRKFSGLFRGSFDWPHGANLTEEMSHVVLEKIMNFLSLIPDLKATMHFRLQHVLEYREPLIAALRQLMQEALASSKYPDSIKHELQ
jgi:polysaccharide pyruvyl transferase WcaK-like protein